MTKSVSQAVRSSLLCLSNQPKTGGVTPPDIGPRNRQWWKDNTPTEYEDYFEYFITKALLLYIRDEYPPYCYQPTNLPVAETVGATPLTPDTVELHGKVTDDGGEKCAVRFQYGETTLYDHYTLWYEGKKTNDVFDEFISNLEGGKTYHYRAQIKNENGVSGGEDKTFTTTPQITVPFGHTNDAEYISLTIAILKGFLNDPGGEPCEYRFQYGEDTTYGNNTAWRPGAWTFHTVSQLITGLTIYTDYHFRVQFRNSAGTFSGEDYSFKTRKTLNFNQNPAFYKQGTSTDYHQAWENCRNASIQTGAIYSDCPMIDLDCYQTPNCTITKQRYFLSFDTHEMSQPPQATLKFWVDYICDDRPPAILMIFAFKKTGNITAADWAAGTLIATLSSNDIEGGTWQEVNVPSEHINPEGNTCFRFVMKIDEENIEGNPPANSPYDDANNFSIWWTDDDYPPTLTPKSCDLPTCTTKPVKDLFGDRATLYGYLDDSGGQECEYRFQYGPTATLGEETIWRAGIISWDTFKEKIKNLTPETTYYYRAQVKNSAGIVSGKIESFTTKEATKTPICTTKEAEGVGYTLAELWGYLDEDGGEECQYRFQYGKALPYIKATGWKTGLHSLQEFHLKITRLDVDTNYHFRAQVKNSAGIFSGEDMTFRTFPTWGKPTCETLPAIEIEHDTARIKGIVNDDLEQECKYRFQWGKTADYGSKAPWKGPVHKGEKYSRKIQRLDAGTLYHFRAEIKNILGANIGKDLTFTTFSAGTTPQVTTLDPEEQDGYDITLKGFITQDGNMECEYRIVWGYGTEYTYHTSWWKDKKAGQAFSFLIDDITPNITCHFRAEIRNRLGTGYGADKTFQLTPIANLPACSTLNAAPIGKIKATLNGRVIWDQGEDCEVRFSYGHNSDCTKSTPWEGGHHSHSTFSKQILALNPFRSYNFRAEVRNSHGTHKGTVGWFTTGFNDMFDFDPTR